MPGRERPLPSRLLKIYLRCRYVVKNDLKMLIYSYKLRFFGRFCLVSAASLTLFNSLLAGSDTASGFLIASNPSLLLL